MWCVFVGGVFLLVPCLWVCPVCVSRILCVCRVCVCVPCFEGVLCLRELYFVRVPCLYVFAV